MHAYWQDAGALPLVLDRAGDHKLIGKDRQDRVFSNSLQLRLLTHCRLSGQEGAVPAWKNGRSNRLAHLTRAEVLQARM